MDPYEGLLRPLFGLMDGQPSEVVEEITIAELKLHRRLVAEAEALFQRLQAEGDDRSLHREYLSKMVMLHSQQTALATMLHILGYIPTVPDEDKKAGTA